MTNLESDARDVMEQIQMAESRHMQMGALSILQATSDRSDMTIRDISLSMAADMTYRRNHNEE